MFGFASLLKGIPGVKFGAVDLVRNFVMSVFMDQELEEQEQVYKSLWLERVEKPMGGGEGVEHWLEMFLSSEGFTGWEMDVNPECERFVSTFEKTCRNKRIDAQKRRENEANDEREDGNADVDQEGAREEKESGEIKNDTKYEIT